MQVKPKTDNREAYTLFIFTRARKRGGGRERREGHHAPRGEKTAAPVREKYFPSEGDIFSQLGRKNCPGA